MMLNEMSSYSSAMQKYKKYADTVDAFAQRDLSPNKRYVKKMCDLYFEESIPFQDICNVFVMYEEHKGLLDACGVSFNNLSYLQLLDIVYRMNGDYCDIQEIPNTIYRSDDGITTVGYISTFDEANQLECDNSWCIASSQNKWDEHQYYGQSFYLIRCLYFSKGSKCRFVMAQVNPNGQLLLWNSSNELLQNEHIKTIPSINEYLTAIGSAKEVLIPRKVSQETKNLDETITCTICKLLH